MLPLAASVRSGSTDAYPGSAVKDVIPRLECHKCKSRQMPTSRSWIALELISLVLAESRLMKYLMFISENEDPRALP